VGDGETDGVVDPVEVGAGVFVACPDGRADCVVGPGALTRVSSVGSPTSLPAREITVHTSAEPAITTASHASTMNGRLRDVGRDWVMTKASSPAGGRSLTF